MIHFVLSKSGSQRSTCLYKDVKERHFSDDLILRYSFPLKKILSYTFLCPKRANFSFHRLDDHGDISAAVFATIAPFRIACSSTFSFHRASTGFRVFHAFRRCGINARGLRRRQTIKTRQFIFDGPLASKSHTRTRALTYSGGSWVGKRAFIVRHLFELRAECSLAVRARGPFTRSRYSDTNLCYATKCKWNFVSFYRYAPRYRAYRRVQI